jgi:hypothetical protein
LHGLFSLLTICTDAPEITERLSNRPNDAKIVALLVAILGVSFPFRS